MGTSDSVDRADLGTRGRALSLHLAGLKLSKGVLEVGKVALGLPDLEIGAAEDILVFRQAGEGLCALDDNALLLDSLVDILDLLIEILDLLAIIKRRGELDDRRRKDRDERYHSCCDGGVTMGRRRRAVDFAG